MIGVAEVGSVWAAAWLIVTVGLVAAPPVILKLALEMSKKILPTASTLTLALVVVTFGIVSASEPSLRVLAVITVG